MYKIDFCDSDGKPVKYLTQWDKNITLYVNGIDLPSNSKCHFCNRNNEATYIVDFSNTNNGFSVEVPNALLKKVSCITAYIQICDSSNESSRAVYTAKIPVRAGLKT